MTKSLATLIKLHKRKLDDMRKELVILLDARDQTLRHLEMLAEEMKVEQAVARTSLEAGFGFTNYLKRTMQRRVRLQSILADAEQKIRNLEEFMRAEFTEQKKFEIMKERKDREAVEEEAEREREQMDEFSTVGYLRNQKAESAT